MSALKDWAELLIFQALKSLFFFLPRELCLLFGRMSGFMIYHLDRRHRHIALSNLMIAFSSMASCERKKIARSSFVHFGQTLADILKLSSLGDKQKKRIIIAEGEEHLQKALRDGKGALLFSAHYGNWEIASFFVSRLGKLWVTARGLDNKLLEKELVKIRRDLGAGIIYKERASKQILHSLRRGEMVAILIDQNVLRSQAVFVDFFGKPAATTPSLASFFLRTRSPIIPVFCFPSQARIYQLKIFEPLKVDFGTDFEQDVLKITQICTKIIESQIRQNPSFWLWFHDRWRSRPQNEELKRAQ